jgi:hypothetical protein
LGRPVMNDKWKEEGHRVLFRRSKGRIYRFSNGAVWLSVENRRLLAEMGRLSDPRLEAPKGVLIDFLLPPDHAEHRLLALQKAFEERWVPKYGQRCARCMFMTHSIGSVIGFWINRMMKHLRLLKFFASLFFASGGG